MAASDPYELYRMATGEDQRDGIVRSGSPGSYAYSLKPDAIGEGPGGSDYTFADKPVNHVSLFDAFRFANWMHNGQGNGDTETGAYTLLGGTPLPSNYMTVTRNPDAIWFLPNEDEWYKAAYYDPSIGQYYDYANGTDVAPNNNLPTSDTGNSANYRVGPQTIDSSYTTGNYDYPHTDIGAYELSSSPYGTFDQMGNVFERTETIAFSAFYRIGRGGAFNTDLSRLSANHRSSGQGVGEEDGSRGFRIARTAIIPEPTSFTLAALGLLSLAWRRRSRQRQLGRGD